jgi:hypothetical protein
LYQFGPESTRRLPGVGVKSGAIFKNKARKRTILSVSGRTMPNDDRYLILVEGSGGTTSEDIKRALSQGTAVLRSVSDFNEFDTHLRHDEGITDLPQFPSQVDETSLEEYMYLTLQNHAAAHSESLATFLTALEETATEHSLQYVQYLLPSVKQSKKFEPIPRLGSFQKTVDTLLPGWWIVWYLEIQDADAPLEFKIYTTTVSGNEDLVHQETCTCTQNVYFGSYRIPPPQKTQAVLKVTGRSIIGNAKPKVFLECDGIPHEAFRAACTAASDTNIAAHRRRVAPLLSRIFDITDPIVRVKLWHDDEREKNLVQQSEVDTSQFQDLNEQIQRLKQSVELLEIENSSLRTDSVQSHAQIEGLRRKLDQAESERRVWNVVRSELQAELTRLSQHLTSETNDKVRVSHELEVAQQEVQALSGQVKLLELQVSPKGGSISSNRSQHVAVLTATVKRLEMQLKTEEGNYAKLQGMPCEN